MATRITSKFLIVGCLLGMLGCASTDVGEEDYVADRKRPVTPVEASKLLGCNDDEVAICIQTNCEIEEYYCTPREDARKMFRAGDFRHK